MANTLGVNNIALKSFTKKYDKNIKMIKLFFETADIFVQLRFINERQ